MHDFETGVFQWMMIATTAHLDKPPSHKAISIIAHSPNYSSEFINSNYLLGNLLH